MLPETFLVILLMVVLTWYRWNPSAYGWPAHPGPLRTAKERREGTRPGIFLSVKPVRSGWLIVAQEAYEPPLRFNYRNDTEIQMVPMVAQMDHIYHHIWGTLLQWFWLYRRRLPAPIIQSPILSFLPSDLLLYNPYTVTIFSME